MKNAKKLLLLLLSLVLLIGVFTIAVLAEETTEAQTATVVYPDGTTDEVAVDAEILTEKFVTTDDGVKLYYGENNTLFKATENWIFTFSVYHTITLKIYYHRYTNIIRLQNQLKKAKKQLFFVIKAYIIKCEYRR